MMITLFKHNPVWRWVGAAAALAIGIALAPAMFGTLASLIAQMNPAPPHATRERDYQAILYESLARENQDLRTLLAISADRRIGAGRVIARPPRTHFDTLLVTMDADADVRLGDYVVVSGMLLGEVIEAENGVAKAVLFSAPGTTVDGRIGDPSAIVIMRGMGGGAFEFEVPGEVAIEPGAVIESAAGEPYAIAIVNSVMTEPGRTSSIIFASAPVPLAELRFVEFVRPL